MTWKIFWISNSWFDDLSEFHAAPLIVCQIHLAVAHCTLGLCFNWLRFYFVIVWHWLTTFQGIKIQTWHPQPECLLEQAAGFIWGHSPPFNPDFVPIDFSVAWLIQVLKPLFLSKGKSCGKSRWRDPHDLLLIPVTLLSGCRALWHPKQQIGCSANPPFSLHPCQELQLPSQQLGLRSAVVLSAGLLQGTVTSWLPVSSVRCKCPCASSGLHHFLTFCYDLEDALNSPPLGPMVGQGEGAAGCLVGWIFNSF